MALQTNKDFFDMAMGKLDPRTSSSPFSNEVPSSRHKRAVDDVRRCGTFDGLLQRYEITGPEQAIANIMRLEEQVIAAEKRAMIEPTRYEVRIPPKVFEEYEAMATGSGSTTPMRALKERILLLL